MKKIRMGNGAATNSVLLMAVQIMTTMLGIIVTKLLSVNFSLEEYGTYSQALLVTSTATSISILGLTNATNYFYNKTEDRTVQKKYITTIFSFQYIIGIICALVIIICRGEIAAYFGNERLNGILIFVGFTPMFQNLMAMYQTLFVSIGRAKAIAARNFIVSTLRLIAVIIACFVVQNIVLVLAVILVLDVGQVIYFAEVFKKDKYALKPKDADFSLLREILAFSIPMSVYVFSNSFSRDIDKYVISAFANTEKLAIYTNAAKILPFDMLTTSLITVLIPIITRYINQKNYTEAQNVFKLYLKIGYSLTFIFVGGAIAVSKHLMLFLYDEKYLGGLNVFVIYLFIDMIRFANVTTILSGAGKTKILMNISLITLAVNGLFNVLSYKMIGFVGPAIVTLILTVMMTVALLYFGAKEIDSKIRNLFDIKEMLLIGGEICIVGIVSHSIAALLDKTIVSSFVILVIAYGMYMLIMVLLNYKRIMSYLRSLNQYK